MENEGAAVNLAAPLSPTLSVQKNKLASIAAKEYLIKFASEDQPLEKSINELLENEGNHFLLSNRQNSEMKIELKKNENLLIHLSTENEKAGYIFSTNTEEMTKSFYLFTGNLQFANVLVYSSTESGFVAKPLNYKWQ